MAYGTFICPVCKDESPRRSWYDDDLHRTVEIQEKCDACLYEFHYAYGATSLTIGDFRTGHYHSDSQRHVVKIEKQFKRRVRHARRAFLRGYRFFPAEAVQS